jgi:RNA polymerase-binding protein DksA
MATTGKRSLVSRAGAAARKVVGRPSAATKTAPKKTATKKTGPKKTAAKATPAKKTVALKKAAPKAAAKKPALKKPGAKKTAPTKTAAKKSPSSKAAVTKKVTPAKKAAPAKKAPAKKAPAKKAPVKTAPVKTAAPGKKAPPVKAAPARKTAPSRSRTSAAKLVVLEAEEPWTKDELNEVRNQLRADVKRLTHELDESAGDLADLMRDAGEGAGSDQADVGSATFERDQEMTIVNNARDMLQQSEHALERIADGTYGVCEVCGNPIGKNRLMVFPRATMCMTCKQREERR